MENGKMSFEQTAQEDLKAFERRLTEVISCLQPTTSRWRLLLITLMVCISGSAYWWLYDPKTVELNFFQSICNHPIFALSSITLIILLILGIHKRVIATTIIAQRARCVLTDFNMSCDDTGKLILRPRPTHENKMLY